MVFKNNIKNLAIQNFLYALFVQITETQMEDLLSTQVLLVYKLYNLSFHLLYNQIKRSKEMEKHLFTLQRLLMDRNITTLCILMNTY